ncbi:MAG: MBL fold metallo-hydrolase [Clostridia bacterium]|nr:MBL fold metallo-hydrolase [Clostridia bacterium]
MKKGKKWLSLLLAGALTLSCTAFAGCSEMLDELLGSFDTTDETVKTPEELPKEENGETNEGGKTPEQTPEQEYPDIQTENLSIHFLEVGNKYTGDCTLIKVGDTEVLIDAGSRQGSAATIVPYIQNYCTDGVLEYVIATHAHQDHIAGFVGTKAAKGIFESFVCETIIDFPLTNATTQIYQNYISLRDQEVAAGATRYSALQCWEEMDGAQRSYELAEGITINILYNAFYEQTTSDENDYSVCTLLSQGDDHYLFTGDLEGEGEELLVQNNDLPKCRLFKGGHHGSPTSNTEALLSVIEPEIVCVCCCCGSDEYTKNIANMFPSQAFVDRVAKYTDQIYVTTIVSDNENGFTSMNGNIVVSSDGKTLTTSFSGHNLKFKDTDWFKENRVWPTDGVSSDSP